MDLGDKDKFGLEKRSVDPLNYYSPSMSSDWRFGGANLTNESMGLVPTDNSIAVCKGDLMGISSCSSVSMVDSFFPTLSDQLNAQNLGVRDKNAHTSPTTSNTLGIKKGAHGSLRSGIDNALDMGWKPPSSISKGDIFLHSGAGILPQCLSQFPADSADIERVARFSCFNGGIFSDTVLSGTELKPVSGTQSQQNDPNMAEVAKDVSLPIEHGATEWSPIKNGRETGGFVGPPDDAKHGIGLSSNELDEDDFSGDGGQEELSMLESAGGEPYSAKGLGSKKRKRSGQESERDQVKGAPQVPGKAAKDNTEIKQKSDQNPTSATTKPNGKHSKDNSQASDEPKEDYIHVRARSGQAKNSHSLAERVRREKISDRMKFLQDLVPGCSKVTGKAVMLDEIINYVQSLQRQVEFLSMKLVAVNPQLDFNIEGLLANDILQPRCSPSSTMGFSRDISMAHTLLHPSHQGLIQARIPVGNPSDALRRTINSQLTAMNGGYKEPIPQLPNMWDDDLR